MGCGNRAEEGLRKSLLGVRVRVAKMNAEVHLTLRGLL